MRGGSEWPQPCSPFSFSLWEELASWPQLIVALRDAAKVGLPASKFVGNSYNISPAIPEQLGAAAEGFRAIQVYSDFGSDIPAMKDINAFKANNKVEKEDVYYMKGWMEGVAISKAIEFGFDVEWL